MLTRRTPTPTAVRRPALALDIDGTLAPRGRLQEPAIAVSTGFDHVMIPERMVSLLQDATTDFDLVWFTLWGLDANTYVSDALKLPQLPVIPMLLVDSPDVVKAHAMTVWLTEHPEYPSVVAVDDDLTDADVVEWSPRAHLVHVDDKQGLAAAHIRQAKALVR